MLKARHYKATSEIKILGSDKEIEQVVLNLIDELERRRLVKINCSEGCLNTAIVNSCSGTTLELGEGLSASFPFSNFIFDSTRDGNLL